eukprot:607931-Pelagomonas_calceolata.AAC.5
MRAQHLKVAHSDERRALLAFRPHFSAKSPHLSPPLHPPPPQSAGVPRNHHPQSSAGAPVHMFAC